jgi:hypothetical protein
LAIPQNLLTSLALPSIPFPVITNHKTLGIFLSQHCSRQNKTLAIVKNQNPATAATKNHKTNRLSFSLKKNTSFLAKIHLSKLCSKHPWHCILKTLQAQQINLAMKNQSRTSPCHPAS